MNPRPVEVAMHDFRAATRLVPMTKVQRDALTALSGPRYAPQSYTVAALIATYDAAPPVAPNRDAVSVPREHLEAFLSYWEPCNPGDCEDPLCHAANAFRAALAAAAQEPGQ